MRVRDLVPGDRFVSPSGLDAIFITRDIHPLNPGLMLVVWWIVRDPWYEPRYSFDALRLDQELIGDLHYTLKQPLGVSADSHAQVRGDNLRTALHLS